MSVSEEPAPQPAEQVGEASVNLPAGKALTESEASNVLRAYPAPVVVLVGAVKSGKTTLLASLHDSFQRGPFAGYFAAGSRTIVGFEERCFESRVASGAEQPSTARTGFAEGVLFYHMKVRNEDLKSPIKHLLLSDMSGEHYERALDSATEMRALTIIGRADHFVHLVDGGKLVSDLGPHTVSNALMLLRRCFEERMFCADARLDILLTKWDLALARLGEQRAGEVLTKHRNAFSRYVGNRVGRLRVTPVAARPHYKSPLPLTYGLQDLFRSWVEDAPRLVAPRIGLLKRAEVSTAFDAFALCEIPELFEGPADD